jgi:excisionase family DNA binding protein
MRVPEGRMGEGVAREPILIDIRTASRILALSTSFLYKASNDGRIPRVKIGSRLLFRVPDLRAWAEGQIEAQARDGVEEAGKKCA